MKILIRSGMTPFDNPTVQKTLEHEKFGSNVGNLVYQYSIYRHLSVDGNILVPDNYSLDFSDERADFINQNFDVYIIPLADAFRNDFRRHLRAYTKLIRKLNIPVHVVGVGVRMEYDPDFTTEREYGEDTKEFVKAVLEKSPMLGLRGEFTGEYLKQLGFIPEKDFTVIGCPSMYTFGSDLHIRDLDLNSQSFISLNGSQQMNPNTINLMNNIATQYENHNFVPQLYPELVPIYGGGPSFKAVNGYPASVEHDFYKEGKISFPLNARTWFEYMRNVDLSIGTRLHGNITGTINGAPTITIVGDARVQELARYHHLPSVPLQKITESVDLDYLLENIDVKSSEKVQGRNFRHYVDFLNKLGINHLFNISSSNEGYLEENSEFDKKIKSERFNSMVHSINSVGDREKMQRIEFTTNWYKAKKVREIQNLKRKNEKLQQIINNK